MVPSARDVKYYLWRTWDPVRFSWRSLGVHLRGLRGEVRPPGTRFVVFGLGRSGSTLLCDLLDAHSRIRAEGEILKYRVPFVRRYLKLRSAQAGAPVYGFKVKIHQLTWNQRVADVRGFLEELLGEGWQLAHLSRRNGLRQVLSNQLRVRTRKSHLVRGEAGGRPRPARLRVDPPTVLERLDRLRAWKQRERQVLAGLPHLPVVYEDHLLTAERQQQTVDRFTDWLDLPPEPVETELVRITPPRLDDLVENADELRRALESTPHEAHLRE